MSNPHHDLPPLSKEAVPEPLAQRLEAIRAELQGREPHRLAALTSSDFRDGEFRFSLWDQPIYLSYPDLRARDAASGTEVSLFQQALLLYYFHTCDGTPVSGVWVSFAELPDGRVYNQAYQGYTGNELVMIFKDDLSAFERVAEMLGGQRVGLGDAAYAFQALPRVPLLVIYWRGDEEFAPNCRILFDASASHHLPTDVCAILGSMLTRRLIKTKGEEP